MTFRRAATLLDNATGGRAISVSTPSWRSRIRKCFSYGSKWMSDAPFLMASTMTLLTKRTIGASSIVRAADLGADFLVAGRDLEVLEVEVVVVVEARHRRVDGLDGAGDARFELVLLDDDRFDAQRGLELDFVERLQIGRIADGDEQALAPLQDRQDAVLQQQLLVDELDDVEVEVDGVEVEQRHAELVRGRDRNLTRVAETVSDEVRHQLRGSCRQWLRAR